MNDSFMNLQVQLLGKFFFHFLICVFFYFIYFFFDKKSMSHALTHNPDQHQHRKAWFRETDFVPHHIGFQHSVSEDEGGALTPGQRKFAHKKRESTIMKGYKKRRRIRRRRPVVAPGQRPAPSSGTAEQTGEQAAARQEQQQGADQKTQDEQKEEKEEEEEEDKEEDLENIVNRHWDYFMQNFAHLYPDETVRQQKAAEYLDSKMGHIRPPNEEKEEKEEKEQKDLDQYEQKTQLTGAEIQTLLKNIPQIPYVNILKGLADAYLQNTNACNPTDQNAVRAAPHNPHRHVRPGDIPHPLASTAYHGPPPLIPLVPPPPPNPLDLFNPIPDINNLNMNMNINDDDDDIFGLPLPPPPGIHQDALGNAYDLAGNPIGPQRQAIPNVAPLPIIPFLLYEPRMDNNYTMPTDLRNRRYWGPQGNNNLVTFLAVQKYAQQFYDQLRMMWPWTQIIADPTQFYSYMINGLRVNVTLVTPAEATIINLLYLTMMVILLNRSNIHPGSQERSDANIITNFIISCLPIDIADAPNFDIGTGGGGSVNIFNLFGVYRDHVIISIMTKYFNVIDRINGNLQVAPNCTAAELAIPWSYDFFIPSLVHTVAAVSTNELIYANCLAHLFPLIPEYRHMDFLVLGKGAIVKFDHPPVHGTVYNMGLFQQHRYNAAANIFSFYFLVEVQDNAEAIIYRFKKTTSICLEDRDAEVLRQFGKGNLTVIPKDLKEIIKALIVKKLMDDNIVGTDQAYYVGELMDVIVDFYPDHIYDFRSALFLDQLYMTGIRLKSAILESLHVQGDNPFDDHVCVLNYLLENVQKNTTRANMNQIAMEMSKFCDLNKGITIRNIKEWAAAYHPNFSIYCICEADGNVFSKQKAAVEHYKSNRHTQMLAFVISNNHLYPITHQKLKNKIKGNLSLDIFERYNISINEFPVYIENATGEEKDDKISVIATNREMEPFMLECIHKSNYLIDQFQISDHEITMFRSPLNNKIYVKCDNWNEIENCCRVCSDKYGKCFDFLPHGQSLSCIAKSLFNIIIGKMESISSHYSYESRNIFENYHQTSIVLSMKDVIATWGNQKRITFQLDKIGCYRDAAYNNICEYPIYNGLDSPISYKGTLTDGYMYLCKPIFIPVGNNEYIEYPSCVWAAKQIPLLKELVGLKEEDIICELPCRKKIAADFLKPYFEATNEMFDKPIRKKLDNFLVGLLNHKVGRYEHGLLTNDLDYTLALCKYMVTSRDLNGYDISVKKMEGLQSTHDVLMIRMHKKWTYKSDCSPIWNVILGNAIIGLIRKIKEFVNTSKIIAIKTDAIVLDKLPQSNQNCSCRYSRKICLQCMNIYEMYGWKWKHEEVVIPIQKVLLKHDEYKFNEIQWNKVDVPLSCREMMKKLEEPALITGEAGAGKTTLLLDIVERMYPNNRIVVLTYMNSAIQNIRTSLKSRNIDCENKFRKWKHKGNLLCCTVDSFFSSIVKRRNKLLVVSDEEKDSEEKEIIIENSMEMQEEEEAEQKEEKMNEDDLSHVKIDWIIIDEISMLPSRSIWELCRIWRDFGCKIICCGDFNQLPPVEELSYYYPNVPLFREMCGANWFNLEYISSCGRYDDDLHEALQHFKLYKTLSPTFKYNSILSHTFPAESNIVFTNHRRNEILKIHPKGCISIGNNVVCELPGNEKDNLRLKDKYGIFQSEFYQIIDMKWEDENDQSWVFIEGIKGSIWCPSQYFLPNVAITAHKYQGRTISSRYHIYNTDDSTISFNAMYTALSRGTRLSDVCCIWTDRIFVPINYDSIVYVQPAKIVPLHQYKKDDVYHLKAIVPSDCQSEGIWYECEEHKVKNLLRYLNNVQYCNISIPKYTEVDEEIINLNTRYNKKKFTWDVDCTVLGERIQKSCRSKDDVMEIQLEVDLRGKETMFIKKEIGTYVIPKSFATYIWNEKEDDSEWKIQSNGTSKYFDVVTPKSIPFGRWYYQLYPATLLKGKLVLVHEPMKNKPDGRRAYTSMPWTTLIKIKECMLERNANQYDYEILQKNTRLFCDLDCDYKMKKEEEAQMIRDLITAMSEIMIGFNIHYIRILHSQGLKTSFHVIYLEEIFENITYQKNLWCEIKKKFESKSPMYASPNKGKGILDLCVYTKNRCMRNIYSTKPNKNNQLLPVDQDLKILKEINVVEYFIESSFVDTYSRYGKSGSSNIAPKRKKARISKHNGDIEVPQYILRYIQSKSHLLPGLDISNMKFNGYVYFLPRIHEGYCAACERSHDRQNGFVYVSMGKYFFTCFADTSKKIQLL